MSAPRIFELMKRVLKLEDETEDTGWIEAELTDDFQVYNSNSNNMPKYRKIGKIVEIRGAVSPTTTLTGSSNSVVICTLPESYRSTELSICSVQQGSSLNRWLLTIRTNGDVCFSRYGTTEFSDASTSVWLPFHAVFMID